VRGAANPGGMVQLAQNLYDLTAKWATRFSCKEFCDHVMVGAFKSPEPGAQVVDQQLSDVSPGATALFRTLLASTSYVRRRR
jgi:hypothetical protein